MKKITVLLAMAVTLMVFAGFAVADVEDGDFHFTPKIGYFDPRATNTDGTLAWGGAVSYQWDYQHEVGLGLLSSSHDVQGGTNDAKSLVWGLGYKHHFDSTSRSQQGHWTLGLDIATHRLKYAGDKWNKMGANLNAGYEWNSKWLAEIGYLFSGSDSTDTNNNGAIDAGETVRMGGLSVLVGYKF